MFRHVLFLNHLQKHSFHIFFFQKFFYPGRGAMPPSQTFPVRERCSLTLYGLHLDFYLATPLTDLLQILCGCSLGGPLLSLLKSGCYPFSMELWVILCNFWPILKKSSSIKPLTRNHSYLVWRVSRGSSF